jgi:hypothetical protein
MFRAHHMARMSSGTGMARKTHSKNQPYRQMPMVILNPKPGSGAHRVRKAVVLEAMRLLGCGELRSADSRSSLVHSPAYSMDGVCKPLPSFVSDFPSRGLQSQTVRACFLCSVCLDSLKMHGIPCRRSRTAARLHDKGGGCHAMLRPLPMGQDRSMEVKGP